MNDTSKVLFTGKTHTDAGGRNGSARSDDGRLDIALSSPGTGGTGTNPEQLFAAGWSACFIAAGEARAPIAVVAIENEPAPRLEVDPPLPGPLSKGQVFIGYRTENVRIVPVYGKGALDVSPRIGHLHVTVDGAPWHWADASNEPIILVGLAPGPHKVLVELADTTHKVIASKTVAFVVPENKSEHAH